MNRQAVNTLIVGLVLVAPGFCFGANEEAADAKQTTPVEIQHEHNQALAHKMMGHINLAQFAMELSLPKEAENHIKKAQGIEHTLDNELPEMTINSSYKYGKVTFDDSATIKSHYIPIVDDVFLISDYEEVFKGSKGVDLNETKAGVVHVGVSVDLREVKKGLDTALSSISNNDYTKAQMALSEIFEGAIVDEEEVDDPVLAISENLAFAKTLIRNSQYDSARMTLADIEYRLNSDGKAKLAGVDKETRERFSNDLKEIKKQLREKDPTLSQRIGDRLDKWGHAVKGWFS